MRFVARKCARLAAVVVAVSALTFFMLALLPGDVAYMLAGAEATPDQIEAIRDELGLDRNVVVRYAVWVAGVVQGDFGASLRTSEPVLEAILGRLPVTVELLVLAQIIALALAVPAGIFAAYKAGSAADRALTLVGFGMYSIPAFALAILMIFVFALRLRWLPATGYEPLSAGLWANLRTMLLPALSIALIEWVGLMRVLRTDMIATLKEDFISLARAKGLSTRRILLRHALRPSSFTLITVLGLQIGSLIGGTIILESIFALPGVGRLLIEAIYARDYTMVQGCILFIAVAYVAINFTVDMLYAALDPRIRMEGVHG